ncbi:CHAD domain-containing protein [Microbulbifer elongatus]|uniref:CHAD domain-containing protein n=1 Tax=Microbulbifer elongatus TaxID=86173 RepID=UPI001CFD4430|nr:CHAD domain-containing protein [Microbulbifer elongatus]
MPYRFRARSKPASNISRVAWAQAGAAIACCQADNPAEAIHSIRKHGKKMRALVRLTRNTDSRSKALYRLENARYRHINLQLSTSRDATSLYHALRDQLGADRFPGTAAYLQSRIPEDKGDELEQAELQLREGMAHIENWDLARLKWGDIERGYCRSYRRARKASKRAFQRETDEAFHTLRKRAKDQWYHSRLLKKRYPKTVGKRVADLKKLSSALGDWRDLRLLCHFVALHGSDNPDMAKERIPLLDLAQQRLRSLRKKIDHLSEQLLHRKKWTFD